MVGPKATCASVKGQKGTKGGGDLRISVLEAWQWTCAPLSSVNHSDPMSGELRDSFSNGSRCWGNSFQIIRVGRSIWSSTNLTSGQKLARSLRAWILVWMKRRNEKQNGAGIIVWLFSSIFLRLESDPRLISSSTLLLEQSLEWRSMQLPCRRSSRRGTSLWTISTTLLKSELTNRRLFLRTWTSLGRHKLFRWVAGRLSWLPGLYLLLWAAAAGAQWHLLPDCLHGLLGKAAEQGQEGDLEEARGERLCQ